MSACLVTTCTNHMSNRGPNLAFHRLPKTLKNEWIAAIKRDPSDNYSNANFICSDHFRAEDYAPGDNGQRKRLRSGAVPSVNLPTEMHKKGKVRGFKKHIWALSQADFENAYVRLNPNLSGENVPAIVKRKKRAEEAEKKRAEKKRAEKKEKEEKTRKEVKKEPIKVEVEEESADVKTEVEDVPEDVPKAIVDYEKKYFEEKERADKLQDELDLLKNGALAGKRAKRSAKV